MKCSTDNERNFEHGRGFHVTSEKNKVKNFRFLPSSGKNQFWLVFSSVDRFVLKIEHGFFHNAGIGIVSG